MLTQLLKTSETSAYVGPSENVSLLAKQLGINTTAVQLKLAKKFKPSDAATLMGSGHRAQAREKSPHLEPRFAWVAAHPRREVPQLKTDPLAVGGVRERVSYGDLP
jgi:hypothetical protein